MSTFDSGWPDQQLIASIEEAGDKLVVRMSRAYLRTQLMYVTLYTIGIWMWLIFNGFGTPQYPRDLFMRIVPFVGLMAFLWMLYCVHICRHGDTYEFIKESNRVVNNGKVISELSTVTSVILSDPVRPRDKRVLMPVIPEVSLELSRGAPVPIIDSGLMNLRSTGLWSSLEARRARALKASEEAYAIGNRIAGYLGVDARDLTGATRWGNSAEM